MKDHSASRREVEKPTIIRNQAALHESIQNRLNQLKQPNSLASTPMDQSFDKGKSQKSTSAVSINKYLSKQASGEFVSIIHEVDDMNDTRELSEQTKEEEENRNYEFQHIITKSKSLKRIETGKKKHISLKQISPQPSRASIAPSSTVTRATKSQLNQAKMAFSDLQRNSDIKTFNLGKHGSMVQSQYDKPPSSNKLKFMEFYRLALKHHFINSYNKEQCHDALQKLSMMLTQEKVDHLYDSGQQYSKLRTIQNTFFKELKLAPVTSMLIDGELSKNDMVELRLQMEPVLYLAGNES